MNSTSGDAPVMESPEVAAGGALAPPRRSFVRRLFLGNGADPNWVRPALLGLLALTAILYLWDLSSSGWANAFYSAAVQAGTKSWKAFFFGSFDSSNFITVDKPPLSLWVMIISARIFGLSSWSILVPQALIGVASVGLLYATVRRWFSPLAGLLAGAVLALTPVAALMFRFNNPDALLVLLLVGAAYATVRAIESGRVWWLIGAGVLVGAGFMTKMMQALIIVPALAIVYLVAGKPKLGRRLWHLLLSGIALLISAGWWVAVVELWPAASRPYIGGSQDNSLFDLIFGYNGFGRITGNETGSVGGMGGGGSRWGATGFGRLFGSDWGGQIAWLIPAAVILGLALLWVSRRGARTDRVRASVLLWGGWLLTTWAVFSFGAGIIHEYYAVALAPMIGALVGIGVGELWKRRASLFSSISLALTMAVTSVWAFVLLDRSSSWMPWLRYAVLIGGLFAAVALLPVVVTRRHRIAVAIGAVGLVAALAGPAAYALQTVGTAHTGSLVTAGPSVSGNFGGGFGGNRGFGQGNGATGQSNGQSSTQSTAQTGQTNQSTTQTGQSNGPTGQGTPGQPPSGAQGGNGGFPGGDGGGTQPGGTGGNGGGNGGGNAGGLLNATTPGSTLIKLLKANASKYDWVAAVLGANNAAGYQLAADEPIMAIGGFNGSDPAPTLAQFKAYVKAGRIHYFVSGGNMGGGGFTGQGSMRALGELISQGARVLGGQSMGSNSSNAIAQWVMSNFTSKTVDGITIYDLTSPSSQGTT